MISNMTHTELERMHYIRGNVELAKANGALHDTEAYAENAEDDFQRSIEIVEEQSEFRRQLIKDILEELNTTGTKKELVSRIKNMIDDSYVEL